MTTFFTTFFFLVVLEVFTQAALKITYVGMRMYVCTNDTIWGLEVLLAVAIRQKRRIPSSHVGENKAVSLADSCVASRNTCTRELDSGKGA